MATAPGAADRHVGIEGGDVTSKRHRGNAKEHTMIANLRRARWQVAVIVAVMALLPGRANAFLLLTAGKTGVFRQTRGAQPKASLRVSGDPVLRVLADPRCPAASLLKVSFASQSQERTDHAAVALPCAKWTTSGSGFRYRDPTGAAAGVREIVYAPGRLVIRQGGSNAPPVAGPVLYVEVALDIGASHYLVRLAEFRRNDAQLVASRRPSRVASAAEAAFWDTLTGLAPREERALALLRRAIRVRPSDGRSQFYLGALLTYRAGRDWPNMGDGVDLAAAQAPLDRAVELLPHDSVPKVFRAFTTYLNGLYIHDAARTSLGVAQLEESTTENVFFNKAVALFILPQYTSGASPYYQTRLRGWLDDVFATAPTHFDVYPNVFSSRLAPHAVDTAALMFGDAALKGGDLSLATQWYGVARAFGTASGFYWEPLVDSRLNAAASRLATQDAVPSDSVVIGVPGVAPCTPCHWGAQ
jgi:hypothetical protein